VREREREREGERERESSTKVEDRRDQHRYQLYSRVYVLTAGLCGVTVKLSKWAALRGSKHHYGRGANTEVL
jgi:hypothetical protein